MMLNYISQKAPLLLVVFCFVGFFFPDFSNQIFTMLPFVLFFLMFFTLVGLDQVKLVQSLLTIKGWIYAFFHSFILMGTCIIVAKMLTLPQEYTLAILGVAATGSLFATPAIVRSIGLDYFKAMTYTITSTLLKPIALYVMMWWFYADDFELNLQAYIFKLVIYILGPMILAFSVRNILKKETLLKAHTTIAKYNIILVFLFPLGLMGNFGLLWQNDTSFALEILMISFFLCAGSFLFAYVVFTYFDKDVAVIAAITSGNRNVLLTYTIAGALLGPVFLPLVGALQFPIYLQPLLIKLYSSRRSVTTSSG